MSNRRPAPWLRSSSEPDERSFTLTDALAVLVVAIAVIAMGVWFVLLASGGIGPGTV